MSGTELTPLQHKLVAILADRNVRGTLVYLAWKTKSNNVAVFSSLMSLRRKGLADYTRSFPKDQWSVQVWFLKDKPTVPVK